MRLSSRLFTSVSARSFFIGTIVVLAVAAFAFTGIGQIGGLDVNTAANVGSQKVTMRQFQESFQQISRQNQSGETESESKRLENINTALNQLIEQKVIIEEATRLGWSANDIEVADWIRKIPAFQNKDTKKFDVAVFEKFMKSGQLSELELYQQGRDAIAANKYYALLGLLEPLPQPLLEEQKKRDNEEFQVEYALVEPSQNDVSSAIKDEAQKFAADEKNKAELQKAYDDAKAEFSRKAQVNVRSILVAWKEATRAQGDALNRTKEQAKALADDLLKQIAAGADFKKLAAQHNDDPNAKAKEGDLGWLDETNIDPETSKAAFALTEQNPHSQVIATPFGYRILQRIAARPAVEQSFTDVKLELAERKVAAVIRRKKQATLEEEISKALSAGDKTKLEELIKGKGITWKRLSQPITAKSQFIEEFGSAGGLLKHLFSLKTEGDLVKELVDSNGTKRIVRLVSRKTKSLTAANDNTSNQDKEARLQARAESFKVTQNFATKAQKKLVEIYERDKEIKKNSALFATVSP